MSRTFVFCLSAIAFCIWSPTATPAQCTATETFHVRPAYQEMGAGYGSSVSLHGEWLAVGAPAYFSDNGSVYLYSFDGTSWVQTQQVSGWGTSDFDSFGHSVQVVADLMVIGAPHDYAPTQYFGRVYVFRLIDGNWVGEAALVSSDGNADLLGHSVAMDGPVLVAGAPETDGADSDSGAAYVFRFDGGSWNEEAVLMPADGAWRDHFGRSVAIDGNRIAVGAPLADNTEESSFDSGAVYVFDYDGTAWHQTARVEAADPVTNARLGMAVSIADDVVVAGAPEEQESAGAAYVFTSDGGEWTQQARLTAPCPVSEANFGEAVWIRDDLIWVTGNGKLFCLEQNDDQWTQLLELHSEEGWDMDHGLSSHDGRVAVGGDETAYICHAGQLREAG